MDVSNEAKQQLADDIEKAPMARERIISKNAPSIGRALMSNPTGGLGWPPDLALFASRTTVNCRENFRKFP